MKQCHKCGTAWKSDQPQPGYRDTCPECAAFLHCCLNCVFHDPSLHNQCRVPNTEFVRARDAANFCDEFRFRISAETVAKQHRKAVQSFESLFGHPSETEASEAWDSGRGAKPVRSEARKAFDQLFRD